MCGRFDVVFIKMMRNQLIVSCEKTEEFFSIGLCLRMRRSWFKGLKFMFFLICGLGLICV